jgi:xanthine/uracil permease
MGTVWTGKTLTAWSALAAVAAFARLPVFELVRRLFPPVVAGLFGATVCANLIW